MPREVSDTDGIAWTCIQAFAGLGNDADKTEAARVQGTQDRVHVVCTPSGGSRSVRVQLPEGWETALDDAGLLQAIAAAQSSDGSP